MYALVLCICMWGVYACERVYHNVCMHLFCVYVGGEVYACERVCLCVCICVGECLSK